MNEPLLFAVAVVGAISMLAAGVVAASRHKKSAMHDLNLANSVGVVETPLQPEGAVLVGGELWRAYSETYERIERGQRVRVLGARDHLLVVLPEIENASYSRLKA